jgi:hypothetical protein
MHKQQQIAKEAGKSFISVVKDYAKAGHSITETGVLLGYSHSAFRRMCQRHGWDDWFCRGEDSLGAKRSRESRIGRDTEGLKRARELVKYDTVIVNGVADTYAGHARRVGLSTSTVYKRKARKPDDLSYIFSTGSHVRPPDSNRGHVWRKG